MNATSLNFSAEHMLWLKATQCANTLYNLLTNVVNGNILYKMFTNQDAKIYSHLNKSGRIGVTTIQ